MRAPVPYAAADQLRDFAERILRAAGLAESHAAAAAAGLVAANLRGVDSHGVLRLRPLHLSSPSLSARAQTPFRRAPRELSMEGLAPLPTW